MHAKDRWQAPLLCELSEHSTTAKHFVIKLTIKSESIAVIPRVFDLPRIASLVGGLSHKHAQPQRTNLKWGVTTFFPRNYEIILICSVRAVISILASEIIKLIARDDESWNLEGWLSSLGANYGIWQPAFECKNRWKLTLNDGIPCCLLCWNSRWYR